MPGIYKLFTAIVAVIGNIGLVSTGEMNPAFSFIGTGLLWGYYRAMKNAPPLPRKAVGALSLTTFIVFLFDFSSSLDIFIAVARMSLLFQTIKSFDIKDPWDPPQVFFMSLLQLMIASELTNSIMFGVVFILFIVFIVVAVILGHFVREGQATFAPFRAPITIVTVITIVITIIFFVSLPRLRSGLWGKSLTRGIKTTGFSDRVDFGSFGTVKRDPTVIMRMNLRPDFDRSHYLRGMTFDYFDGVAWYDTLMNLSRVNRDGRDFFLSGEPAGELIEAEIMLEPIDTAVIFTLKKPYKIRSPGYRMRQDSAGSLYMKQKHSKRFHYTLYSVDAAFRDSRFNEWYLQIPDNVTSAEKIVEEIITDKSDHVQAAKSIQQYLRKNYRYSLKTERPSLGVSVIDDFLLSSKRGYCEHFATAMTLMLREAGIPARLVTGFLSDEKNEFGDYYLVRQSDAHSWVEAFIDGRWMLFDPTPPESVVKRSGLMMLFDTVLMSWNRYVVGYSDYDRKRMIRYVFLYHRPEPDLFGIFNKRIVPAAIVILIMLLCFTIARKKFPLVRYKGVSADYVNFRRKVKRSGGIVTPASTSEDVLREATGSGKFDADSVKRLIERYRRLRFSGEREK